MLRVSWRNRAGKWAPVENVRPAPQNADRHATPCHHHGRRTFLCHLRRPQAHAFIQNETHRRAAVATRPPRPRLFPYRRPAAASRRPTFQVTRARLSRWVLSAVVLSRSPKNDKGPESFSGPNRLRFSIF